MSPDEIGMVVIACAVALIVIELVVIEIVIKLAIARKRRLLRQSVFDNLDAAVANGHFELDGYLHDTDAEDIALDVAAHITGVWDKAAELTPYVHEWLDKRGVK